MHIKSTLVILTTIAALAVGCDSATSPEPGPLERASSPEPTLTSTVPLAPTSDLPKSAKSVEDPKADPSPPEEIEPSHEEPTLQSEDGITIHRLITAPEVEGREPIAASSVFGHEEEKVYAFLDVSNESPEKKTLTVFFIGPSGKVSGGVELTVPASVPRWRTWAYTRFFDEAGLWRVEVRNAEGTLVGALPFEVAEGC